jgi:biotin carboxyl carrier protein
MSPVTYHVSIVVDSCVTSSVGRHSDHETPAYEVVQSRYTGNLTQYKVKVESVVAQGQWIAIP